MKTKIKIIVRSGIVTDVFSTDSTVGIEIIDTDSQDEAESDKITNRLTRLENRIANGYGKLKSVWP